ncbi:MAG: flagellar hook assembly protein FlgD [Eubacteriales bacterium]
MEVNGTNAYNTSDTTSGKSSLSVDDFLQIMAAELKNQNPMGSEGGSGSNTDYISQLAQFTMLEQMTDISDGLDLISFMSQQQYSFSLIGKEVTVQDGEETVDGTVDKVKFENGYAIIVVNDQEYYLGSIIEVRNTKNELSTGE